MINSTITRPDQVIRSGIIEPYNIMQESPVTQARLDLNPFLRAVGDRGGVSPLGLGLVTPQVIRTLSGDTGSSKWLYGAGGVLLGFVAGWIAVKAL
jgi:hypothetical protein